MVTSEFAVTGMTCGHCEKSVREEVSKVAGVENVEVSVQSGRLVVNSATPVSETDVIAAVHEAGYRAVPA